MADLPRVSPWRRRSRRIAYENDWITDEAGILYLATGLMDGTATPDGTEELEVRRVPFEETLAMTRDGRITDVLSMVAIQAVALERLAQRGAPDSRASLRSDQHA